MGTFKNWLAGLTGRDSDGVERRQDARPSVIKIDPSDMDPASGALRTDRFMSMLAAEQAQRPGALLLIDMAERVGIAETGNAETPSEALVLMALAIRQAVRADDLVTHVEGYRFAVLLRGAPQELADAIAQRICESVDDTVFMTAHGIAQLDIAVGGAMFEPGKNRDIYTDAGLALDAARTSESYRVSIG